jgi:N,N-dimethylformamidase
VNSTYQSHRVVAPERAGLYYLHATTAAGATTSFPWIVSPAEPRAAVAVLSSTLTQCAYNHYGGRSNYVRSRRALLRECSRGPA